MAYRGYGLQVYLLSPPDPLSTVDAGHPAPLFVPSILCITDTASDLGFWVTEVKVPSVQGLFPQ